MSLMRERDDTIVVFSKLPGAVLLCLFLSSQACAEKEPWHLPDWTHRQVVELTTTPTPDGVNAASVRIELPLAAGGNRDASARVLDADGDLVPFEWVPTSELPTADPSDARRLRFEVGDPKSLRYFIYSGNPDATSAEETWDKRVGQLTLETRPSPKGIRAPRNWWEMMALLRKATERFGEGPRRQINDPENPFGPSDEFISIYRGTLYCPVAGAYGFATDSDDASFLLIDERLVVNWPGGHAPSGKFDHFGTVNLTAGLHKIEYYHVQAGGGTLAKAGWRPPGENEFILIPEHAFAGELRARTVALEQRDKPLNAFFTFEPTDSIQFGAAGPSFTTLTFSDCSRSAFGDIASRRWDFGGGAAAARQKVSCIFPDAAPREVTLFCRDDLGYEDAFSRRVVTQPDGRNRVDVFAELALDNLLLEPGEPARMLARFSLSGGESVELTLRTRFGSETGRPIWESEEPLTLTPEEWTAREYAPGLDGAPALEAGEATLSLEYLGAPVVVRKLAVCRAADPWLAMQIRDNALCLPDGTRLALRLDAGRYPHPLSDVIEKLKSGAFVNVLVADDLVNGDDSDLYPAILEERLRREFPEAVAQFSVLRQGHETDNGDANLADLVAVPHKVRQTGADLVVVGSAFKGLIEFAPVIEFERVLHALVDRIGAGHNTALLLIAAPPTISSPGLAADYGIAVKRVGLARSVAVADAYTAFHTRAAREGAPAEEGWRTYYRDPDRSVALYRSTPNRRGQEIIAETILHALLNP